MAPRAKMQPNTYDAELAKFALQFSNQEQAAIGGQFISFRGGQITVDGQAIPNNELACVVLDGIMENVYYDGAFDPENPMPPACFAFGRDEKDMKPHEIASKPQCAQCLGCPKNEWASADKGRGKACRNTRRLAIIPAGSFIGGRFQALDSATEYDDAKLWFAKLPVTSVKAYAGYVKQVANALQRPPFGVYTKIKTIPDAKTQFRVIFEVLGNVPAEIMGTILQKYTEATQEIEFPYQPMADNPAPTAKGKSKKSKF